LCAHELGHALGQHHEQNNPNHDDFVGVNSQSIKAGKLMYIFIIYNDYTLICHPSLNLTPSSHYKSKKKINTAVMELEYYLTLDSVLCNDFVRHPNCCCQKNTIIRWNNSL
jgi:hypothetical protein